MPSSRGTSGLFDDAATVKCERDRKTEKTESLREREAKGEGAFSDVIQQDRKVKMGGKEASLNMKRLPDYFLNRKKRAFFS